MQNKTIITILLVTLVISCSSTDVPEVTWGWYVIDPRTSQGWNNIIFMLNGFSATIRLSIVAAVFSMMIGLIVVLPGLSENRWIRLPSRIYVEFIRSVPLLPMLLWVFYGFPFLLKSMGVNIPIDPFWGAVITLSISDSAFTAEIYRGGIQSIEKGQTEAAKTVGLNYYQTMSYVILPQALRRILPALANQFIYIVKMSAFAYVIGMQELTKRAFELNSNEYRALEIYTFLIFEYLILVLVISFFVRWLERKLGADQRR